MDSFLDAAFNLPKGTNIYAIAISTFLGAVGKFFGTFICRNIMYYIILTFILNAISLFFCIYLKTFYGFLFFRSIQGFFSGIQASIAFGLMGTLKDNKQNFSNFTGISSTLCTFTSFFLFFINPKYLIGLVSILNILAAFTIYFYYKKEPMMNLGFAEKLDFESADNIENTENISISKIKDINFNKNFLFSAMFLGLFLGSSLLIMGQQKTLLISIFKTGKILQNILITLPFIASSIISFSKNSYSNGSFLIITLCGFWFIFWGIELDEKFIFSTGIVSIYCAFSIINPIVFDDILKNSKNKFLSSSYFAFFRSLFTSLIIGFMPTVANNNIITVAAVFCFILASLYVFYKFKDGDENIF
jgi:MFS family permease